MVGRWFILYVLIHQTTLSAFPTAICLSSIIREMPQNYNNYIQAFREKDGIHEHEERGSLSGSSGAMNVFLYDRPSMGMSSHILDCSEDFDGEIVTEAGFMILIIFNCCTELLLRFGMK